eukprot:CAMPEP_0173419796 /NCGR_PEP_ID=MMETSP1357-20121228/1510_1 /TAXON_ID=77926 /ORGANISM="Hemiselmis rufescens, Strain PCC563" /LENGTH=52 /DNA_ID=CAMNT_0014382493 /DNA_START=245 /DNA_END=403 /DNA_ORIENTATION=+
MTLCVRGGSLCLPGAAAADNQQGSRKPLLTSIPHFVEMGPSGVIWRRTAGKT